MIEIKNKSLRRIVIIFVISLGCEAAYLLPYLRWTYYDTMLAAFNFTNVELTSLGSIFGVIAMFAYFFGGPIADKFSSRLLLTAAYGLTGISGFWFATFPGYGANVILYIIWGITTTLLMWDTMLRVTRTLGTSEEQGRLFGVLEGVRGVFAVILSFLLVAVFARFADEFAGLSGVIIAISIACLLAAVLAFLFVPDRTSASENAEEEKFRFKDLKYVLVNPAVWVLALIIMCCYSMFSGLGFLTPYATEILGVSASAGATIAIFRQYVCKTLGGPVGGVLADKISVAKTLLIGFVLAIVAVVAFIVLPTSSPLPLVIAVIMIFAFIIFAMRGIYYAAVDQIGVPIALSGTAMGVMSVIGFMPDIYFNLISGYFLDSFPGLQGYHYIFYVMIAFGVVGALLTVVLMRMIKKNEQNKSLEPTAEENVS